MRVSQLPKSDDARVIINRIAPDFSFFFLKILEKKFVVENANSRNDRISKGCKKISRNGSFFFFLDIAR